MDKKLNKKIVIVVALVACIAIVVTVIVMVNFKKPEPSPPPTTTEKETTTEPFVLLSEIEHEFRTKQIIGRIVSEDLNIDCNLVFGTTNECLNLGAGIHKTSSLPGFYTPPVIAGHCQTVFKGFKNAEIGHKITIEMPYGNYVYEIKEIKIIDKSEFSFSILKEPIDQAIFYTCYPFEKANYTKKLRLFLYCDRVSGDRILDDISGPNFQENENIVTE